MKYAKTDFLKFSSGIIISINFLFLFCQNRFFEFLNNLPIICFIVILFMAYYVGPIAQVGLYKVFPSIKINKKDLVLKIVRMENKKLIDQHERIIFMKHIGINIGVASLLSFVFLLIKFVISLFQFYFYYDLLIMMGLYLLAFIICVKLNRENLKFEEQILEKV